MNKIEGQVIYCGPTIRSEGLQYGRIFKDGVHDRIYKLIERCPAVGSLIVPIREYRQVARPQLNFDLARNMRGTTGKFVIFYREVQNWLSNAAAGATAGLSLKQNV